MHFSPRHWMVVIALAGVTELRAAAPLHERIDSLLNESFVTAPAPPASDGTFVRRIYLDLTGGVPPAAEARAFLSDPDPQKRAKLVDRLLADPRFVRHMTNVLDVMLMERRRDQHVKSGPWRKFLTDSLRENKPLNELIREMLAADGSDPDNRAPAKFYLEREGEVNLLTRDVGRIFFGMDLQCAQCHDHPLIDDYLQSDYYGLYAFLSRTYLFADKKKKISYLAEKADGEVKYTSVFTQEEGRTAPRLPTGQLLSDEPEFAKGEEYQVKPDKNTAGVPKYSRRQRLAEVAATGDNHAFNRNLANRLWAHMFGRGLVHPVDLHHSDNPSSHPQLLEMLSGEIAAMKFDLRGFLRELALTEAYQRSYFLPEQWPQLAAELQGETTQWQQQLEAAQKQTESAAAAAREAFDKFHEARSASNKADEALQPLAAAEDEARAARDKTRQQLMAAVEAEAQAKSLAGLLADAEQAAGQALAALGEQPELPGVIAVLKSRSADAAAARDQAAAAVPAASKAVQSAEAQLAAAAEAARPARQQAEKLRQQHQEQAAALNVAQQEQAAAQRRRDDLQRRLNEAGALRAAADKLAQFHEAEQAAQSAQQPLPEAVATAEAANAAVKQRQTEMNAVSQQVEATQAQLDAASDQASRLTDAVALLASAGQSLQAALDKASDDDLARTAKLLTTKHADYVAQQAAAQQQAEQSQTELQELRRQAEQLAADLPSLQAARDQQQKALDQLQAQADQADQQATTADQQLQEALDQVHDQWSRRCAITGLKALTPEQLCWSILRATGAVDVQVAAAEAELNKKSPLSEEALKDPEQVAARREQAREQAYDKLQGNVSQFVQLFGSGAGQPQDQFFATADQALFFANGSQVRGWIATGGAGLFGRLSQMSDNAALADELYVSVLSRPPSPAEMQDVDDYLQSRGKDRGAAVQELIWGLITSIEFRFRH